VARLGRKRGERATPFVYLGCTFALVAFAIPSVLRPPPDQATTSAEFSPDAPPDEEAQAIISSLQQAGSSGAGADMEHDHHHDPADLQAGARSLLR